MCGIAGVVQCGLHKETEDFRRSLSVMADALVHRGPDDSGIWMDNDNRVGLCHRRLSILDLSPHGHQPMVSACGRYVIVFNGEIYNFSAMRKELEQSGKAAVWRGHSDTEILLAAIAAWGLGKTLSRCIGMFAFAVWDKQQRVLHLARDRMGEKPLYYGYQKGVFLFGSELKALKSHPAWQGEIDRNALTLLLRYNYIPAPYSIYQDIHKLAPGTYLTLSIDKYELPDPVIYWSLKSTAENGQAQLYTGSEHDAVQALDAVLRQAVAGQMVADVPLGAFLSGGIDSSLIVALMQAQSSRPVKTFSIGFNEADYNEAEHAKAVAKHLGTEHTELYVTPQQVMSVIPEMPAIYDEPFSDSSQMPTYLVSRMARQHVTVSLSGDGGDELFGGYNRYFQANGLWRKLVRLPSPVRRLAARGLISVPARQWNQVFRVFGFIHEMLQDGRAGDRLHKLAGILASSQNDVYKRFLSHWDDPAAVVIGGQELPTVLDQGCVFADFEQQMMYLDSISYLPDDILVKVDRAAMAVSLETRVPMLDHRVVEFAWQLPLSMKIRQGQGKWLLKQVLYQYVPQSMLDRPKMGFGVPIDSWMRGPLRDWVESLLDARRLQQEGFFNSQAIRQKWEEHLSGKRNWQYYIWDILMFQAWLEHWQHN